MVKFAFLLLVLLAFTFGEVVSAAEMPKKLKVKVAFEISEYYPWSMPDGTGVDFMLLREVGRQLDVEFEFTCMSWTNCLAKVRDNKVDALLNASYNNERAKYAHYPVRESKLISDYRTHFDGYLLYRVKGSKAHWVDGKLLGHDGKVAAQKGFSVIKNLKAANVEVADQYESVQEIFDDMISGKIDTAALMPITADYVLEREPKYAGIEKLQQQICFKPYFLIFSRKFYRDHPDMAWKVWKMIGKLRSSAMYGQWINKYTSQTDDKTDRKKGNAE